MLAGQITMAEPTKHRFAFDGFSAPGAIDVIHSVGGLTDWQVHIACLYNRADKHYKPASKGPSDKYVNCRYRGDLLPSGTKFPGNAFGHQHYDRRC